MREEEVLLRRNQQLTEVLVGRREMIGEEVASDSEDARVFRRSR